MNKKILTAFLYPFSLILTFILVLMGIVVISNTTGPHELFGRTGDIDIILLLIVLGTTVAYFSTTYILKLEKNDHPSFEDHFRQSAFIYGFVIFFFLFIDVPKGGIGNMYGHLIVGVAGMGILGNLATIIFCGTLWKRKEVLSEKEKNN